MRTIRAFPACKSYRCTHDFPDNSLLRVPSMTSTYNTHDGFQSLQQDDILPAHVVPSWSQWLQLSPHKIQNHAILAELFSIATPGSTDNFHFDINSEIIYIYTGTFSCISIKKPHAWLYGTNHSQLKNRLTFPSLSIFWWYFLCDDCGYHQCATPQWENLFKHNRVHHLAWQRNSSLPGLTLARTSHQLY